MKFTFKPLQEENLRQLFEWLGLPHVAQWWVESRDWQTFAHKYHNRLNAEDIGSFFIFHQNTPIGYISWYLVAAYDPILKEKYPKNSFGLDLFIADLNYVGKGYGPEIIKQFTKQEVMPLKPSLIIVDPEITNTRAIRVYEKAGFIKTITKQTMSGSKLITAQIMELEPTALLEQNIIPQ